MPLQSGPPVPSGPVVRGPAINYPPADASPPDDVEEINLTRVRRRWRIRIDPDVFHPWPAISGEDMLDVTSLADAANTAMARVTEDPQTAKVEARRLLAEIMGIILRPESAALFMARFADRERPIELEQAMEVLNTAMERYGMVPTPPPDGSATGSANPGGGNFSTATVPDAASIPAGSPPTGS